MCPACFPRPRHCELHHLDDRRAACYPPQVGNAFTFDVYLVGSLTRIQADAATCGPGGAAMRPGTTSTGLQALSWTSTKRGIQRVTLGGQSTCVTSCSDLWKPGRPNGPVCHANASTGRAQRSGRAIGFASLHKAQSRGGKTDALVMPAADAARAGVCDRGADRVVGGCLGRMHQGLGEHWMRMG